MGMTIDEAMEEIIKIKRTKYKDDNISDFSQALSIAFLTMKNYQILKNSYNDRLNADMVAILTELQTQIEENSYPENVYGDEYGINEIISTDDIYQRIQQIIDKLKENKE